MSSLASFLVTLGIAIAGPLLAMRYLRPILLHVLARLCADEQDGADSASGQLAADFWVRAAYLLAISGTAVLVLMWGDFGSADPVQALRRSLLLVAGGVFFSVAFIARNVWNQVMAALAQRRQLTAAAGVQQELLP